MYHTVIPVTSDHNPIIVEGQLESQIIIFNAGPSTIEAQVWMNWKGKVDNKYADNSNEPNLRLELRAGSQKIISGSFIRVLIKKSDSMIPSTPEEFAAIGVRVLITNEEYILP